MRLLDPHSFLVFDRPWLSVVACPLLDLVPEAAYEFAAWRTLTEVSNCDVYLPIIAAFSRVASHCQRGTPVSLRDVSDGAMRARRIVALPYTPSSVVSTVSVAITATLSRGGGYACSAGALCGCNNAPSQTVSH